MNGRPERSVRGWNRARAQLLAFAAALALALALYPARGPAASSPTPEASASPSVFLLPELTPRASPTARSLQTAGGHQRRAPSPELAASRPPPAGAGDEEPRGGDPLARLVSFTLRDATALDLQEAFRRECGLELLFERDLIGRSSRGLRERTIDLQVNGLPVRRALDCAARVLRAQYRIERGREEADALGGAPVVWFSRGYGYLARQRIEVNVHRADALYAAADGADLERAAEELVKPALWWCDRARLSVDAKTDRLFAVLPAAGHRRIRDLLARLRGSVLRGPRADAAPPPALPAERLDRWVVASAEDRDLREFVGELAEQAQITIGFDSRHFRRGEGYRRGAVHLGRSTLRQALDELVRQGLFAGYTVEAPGLVWLYREGRKPLTSQEALFETARVAAYDVRRLTREKRLPGEFLLWAVRRHVAPESWGRIDVAIFYLPETSRLVVAHAPEVQARVSVLLGKLERMTDEALGLAPALPAPGGGSVEGFMRWLDEGGRDSAE